MRTILWSQAALTDFEDTAAYLAARDLQAARLVTGRIDAAIRQLAEMPSGRPGRVPGTYEKSVLRTPYIIAYTVADRMIVNLRVIHGNRDWPEGTWPA